MAQSGNRIVTFEKPMEMKVNTFKFPELITPQGKKAPHGAILKIVTTNICGSDLHIYRGSFEVPKGMTMGHEMTGEVIEVGSDVEFIKKGDIVSVPFNVGCGRCYNCKHMRSDVCEHTIPKSIAEHMASIWAVGLADKGITFSSPMQISICCASPIKMRRWRRFVI